MTTVHDFGGVLGQPLDTFFGLSQIHGHGSWLVCEVALTLYVMPYFHTVTCVAVFPYQVCLLLSSTLTYFVGQF